MGCNFYVKLGSHCPTCGHATQEDLHIGKSSAGWCFALHVIPELGLINLTEWFSFVHGKEVCDEYGDPVSFANLASIITQRSWDRRPFKPDQWYKTEEEFLRLNGAEWGPNGLLRSKIDGVHCVGHGEGTWDYIQGEFS